MLYLRFGHQRSINVKELLKHAKGYCTLRTKYTTKEMRVRLYAGLVTYRRVTDGPSVNPMDYMFSTKYMLNISTAYGFKIYMALHLKPVSEPFNRFSSKMVRTTYSLYQATLKNNTVQIEKFLGQISTLHNEIDVFLEDCQKDIDVEVTNMAYHQMCDSSMEKRMERLMEKRD